MLPAKQALHATHWPRVCVCWIAVSAGVWLRAAETEISALWLGKDFSFLIFLTDRQANKLTSKTTKNENITSFGGADNK